MLININVPLRSFELIYIGHRKAEHISVRRLLFKKNTFINLMQKEAHKFALKEYSIFGGCNHGLCTASYTVMDKDYMKTYFYMQQNNIVTK